LALTPGTRVGPYEITGAIGAGGMGEVYRATDSNLKRSVAIKVLPAAMAGDADRLARFQREAEVLAALNHPNIAAIYGLEKTSDLTALVMELVEGEDLSAHIARGAIPLADALPIARQIADALEAAHEQGIIHRDLKPANVKVRADGTVKVLDFGLAKAMDPVGASGGHAMNSPTMTARATQMGMIIGTAAYMSPEQARGKAVDRRADIWAFGVVLYEMITGRRAFEGDEITDVLAAVLRQDIDWTALPANTPPRLRRLLERALDRDPKQRLRDIGEARVEIAKIEAGAPETSLMMPAPSSAVAASSSRLPWLIAGAFGLAFVAALILWAPWRAASVADSGTVAHLSVALEDGDELSTFLSPIAISDDGLHIAYIAARSGKPMLVVRAIAERTAKTLKGTDGAESPFFSPNGQWIGFFAGGKLKKIAVGGAALQPLADAPFERGGSWAADGYIYFAPTNIGGIWRVPEGGGAPSEVSHKDMAAGEISHRWPQVVGNTLLFTMWTGPGNDEGSIVAQTLGAGEHRVIVKGGHAPHYSSEAGLLFYSRLGELFAVPWTPSQSDLGRAVPVAAPEHTRMTGNEGVGGYAVSANGTLLYLAGGRAYNANRLVWVDRAGKQEFPALPERDYEAVVMSPDGRRAVVQLREGTTGLWLYDIGRGALTPIGPSAGSSQSPQWTFDGSRVVYRSTQAGLRNLFWRSVDGTGGEERLLTKPDVIQSATSVSPDGHWVVFNENSAQEVAGVGIWVAQLEGNHESHRLLPTGAGESDGQISPDGHWIAYQMPVSSRQEIYVAPFPGSGPRHQVSVDGGEEPLWSRDGRELFFQNGAVLMSASVTPSTAFSSGTPRPVFEGRYVKSVNGQTPWAVTTDGKRFLRIQKAEPDRAITAIDIVLNWFAELKPLVARK
jgi:serine/threonine-protein kinase